MTLFFSGIVTTILIEAFAVMLWDWYQEAKNKRKYDNCNDKYGQ